MQRVLLALLILFLGAAGIGLFLVLQPASFTPEQAVPGAAPVQASPEPEAQAAVELSEPVQQEPEPDAPAEQVADEAAVEAVEVDTSRTLVKEFALLHGSLVRPDGTPADELLGVRVLAKPPVDDSPFPLLSMDDDEEEVLAEAQLDASGSFELRVPLDEHTVWIELDAHYLFLDEAFSVELEPETTVVLRPRLGAWITGRLIVPADASAEDLEDLGERVYLRPDALRSAGAMGISRSDRSLRRNADLDDALGFEFTGVTTGQPYNLYARPPLLTAAQSDAIEPAPGEHVVVDLVVTHGARLSGRVIDAAGEPVAEAELELTQNPQMFGQGGFEVRDGESEADGTFDLHGILPGTTHVKVSGDGFIESSSKLELSEGQHLTDQVFTLDTGNTVTGRVLWEDRTPVADVEVNLRFDLAFLGGMEAFNAMKGADGEARTDEQGRFTITGLGKGPFTLQTKAPNEREPAVGLADTRPDWEGRVDKVRPGDDVELILTPPLGIDGRVVNDLGEPITEFHVRARSDTGGMLGGLGSESASDEYDDEDGQFHLDGLREGEWLVQASAEGYGTPEPVPLSIPQVEGSDLVLVLERAGSASGIVLGPEGAPVPWATVGPKFTLADIGRLGGQGAEAPKATCDEEGRFLLEGLTPGALSLVAHSEEFADSEPLAMEVAAAETVSDLVLELRIGGRILGLIVDEEGKPAPGRTIIAQVPTDPGNQRFANSDLNGEFVFESLAPGTYQVMAFGNDSEDESSDDEGDNFTDFFADMKLTMAEVKDGEDTEVTLGSVSGDPVAITGRVVAGGKPVSGVLVTFFDDGEKMLEGMKFSTTGSDGAFSLKLGHPGRYLVNVQKVSGTGMQQNVEFSRTIPEGESHELTLELPMAGIAGRVYNPDRKPAGGARISLSVDGPIRNGSFTGGNYAEIQTDDDGYYELLWLRPGQYSVAAGGPSMMAMFGATGTGPGRQVRSGLKVREGQLLKGVDFRLEEPGTLKGSVLDLGGQPVAEAAIFLRDSDGNSLDRFSFVATDSAGQFTYPGLTPGAYLVTARGAGFVSAEGATANVRSGQQEQIQLTVDAGTTLIVSLSDKQGNPVECSVEVLDSEGHQVNGMWSMSELMAAFSTGGFSSLEQKIGPLPPGKYRVLAKSSDGLSANKPVTLRSSSATRKLNLRLD